MNAPAIERTVFIISDGTGITAETFSHSVLSQFESVAFKQVRVPFIDSVEKADSVVQRINRCAADQGVPPDCVHDPSEYRSALAREARTGIISGPFWRFC